MPIVCLSYLWCQFLHIAFFSLLTTDKQHQILKRVESVTRMTTMPRHTWSLDVSEVAVATTSKQRPVIYDTNTIFLVIFCLNLVLSLASFLVEWW